MKKYFTWSLLWACLLIMAPRPAGAQFIVRFRPTAPVWVGERPLRPGPHHIWIEGHWRWNRNRADYVWVEGHWIRARRGQVWVNGHWEDVPGQGSRWIPGHWGI
jgi:hypothetical protein